MDHVAILDTILRDGEQAPGFSMNVRDKLLLARQLARLNVDVVEAGFPIASDGDFEALKKIVGETCGVSITVLAGTNPGDIRRCRETLEGAAKPRIHTFLATSDIHLRHKLRDRGPRCRTWRRRPSNPHGRYVPGRAANTDLNIGVALSCLDATNEAVLLESRGGTAVSPGAAVREQDLGVAVGQRRAR